MAEPPPHLERLADALQLGGGTHTAFVALRSIRHGFDRSGGGYYDLTVSDASARLPAKIWGDSRAYGETARAELEVGSVLKLMFTVGRYRDAAQLTVQRLRPIDDHEAWNPDAVFGPGWATIADLCCETLVFDIETVPAVEPAAAPESIARAIARAAERMDGDLDKARALSPYFGKVVSLAFAEGEGDEAPRRTPHAEVDAAKEASTPDVHVLAVAPKGLEPETSPDFVRTMSEAELLRSFWHLADAAELVVSYNGRGFDVPFLVARSLIHGIPARVDLLSSPYSLRPHLDLFRLVGQRGGPGSTSLDVVCWALGIASPKGAMDGSMVAPAYARGDLEAIARYNAADVRATRSLYRHVREHLLPFRADW